MQMVATGGGNLWVNLNTPEPDLIAKWQGRKRVTTSLLTVLIQSL
jgi:hypothetical protein